MAQSRLAKDLTVSIFRTKAMGRAASNDSSGPANVATLQLFTFRDRAALAPSSDMSPPCESFRASPSSRSSEVEYRADRTGVIVVIGVERRVDPSTLNNSSRGSSTTWSSDKPPRSPAFPNPVGRLERPRRSPRRSATSSARTTTPGIASARDYVAPRAR